MGRIVHQHSVMGEDTCRITPGTPLHPGDFAGATTDAGTGGSEHRADEGPSTRRRF